MCLIFFSLNNHPDYKLIVAANRDEFYNRRTSPADYWKENPQVLAGKDLEAGGTWMGIRTDGRLSMVTNYRDPANINPMAPSRGHLVSEFLLKKEEPLPYLTTLSAKGNQYNGFNLIVGNPNELYYYSNYGDGIKPIPPGLHGLSNHLLDTAWPKVVKGLAKMEDLLNAPAINSDAVLDALADDTVAPDNQLPDTGVGLERERALSSMFIKTQGYGSRTSTVLTIDRHDRVHLVERTYDTATFSHTSKAFEFLIEKHR